MNHHCIGRFVDGQWKGKWRSELGDEYHRLPGQVRDWTGWSRAGQNTKFLLTHQFSCHTLGGDKLSILPDSKIKSWHSEKLCFVSFCIKETKFGGKTDESAQYMFQRLFLSFKPFAPHPKTPTGRYVRMRWSVCSNVYWFEPRGWYMRNGAQVQVTGD